MRTALVPVLLCLAVTSCSSSEKGDEATPAGQASASSSASPAATASVAASALPSSSSAPSGVGVSQAPSTAPSASSAASTPGAVRGTAPGDYTYDVAGSYSLGGAPQQADGTATLTVTSVRDGRQTSTLKGEQGGGDTVQEVVLRSDGVYLARLSIGTPVNKEFRPATPVLLFPTPATVGRKWSWQATSTDRTSTVRTTSQVLRTETLTVGGERVATVVLQSRLVITGDVDYTADVTTWVATAYRLPVKDHTKGSGKWGTVAFTTDVTSTMRSVHPA